MFDNGSLRSCAVKRLKAYKWVYRSESKMNANDLKILASAIGSTKNATGLDFDFYR